MASIQRPRAPHGAPCVCNVCGAAAQAIPGMKHRRCGGSQGAAIKEKHAPRAADRGKWESGAVEETEEGN